MTTAKAKAAARAAKATPAKAAPAKAPAATAAPVAAAPAPAPAPAPVPTPAPVVEVAPVAAIVEAAPVAVVEAAPVAAAPVPAAAPAIVKDVVAQVEHAVAAGKETIEQVVKASKDAAAKGFDKAVALTKEPMAVKAMDTAAKAQATAAKACEDTMASAKENLDAVVKASQVLTHGMQELGKSMAGLAQEAVEESVAASKKLMTAKTLKDAVDVQSTLAKEHLDRMLAHSTQLSAQTVKMFETAFAPVQARVTAAIEKLVKHHH